MFLTQVEWAGSQIGEQEAGADWNQGLLQPSKTNP